jgi:hypothetical protein
MLTSTLVKDNFSLEDFMANPPDRMEWVDGHFDFGFWMQGFWIDSALKGRSLK